MHVQKRDIKDFYDKLQTLVKSGKAYLGVHRMRT